MLKNINNITLKKAMLHIPEASNAGFEGYIEDGKDWNGWACPWFELEVCYAILDEYNYESSYDEETQTLTFEYKEEGEETIQGQYLVTETGEIKLLFPLGNCDWIWQVEEVIDD